MGLKIHDKRVISLLLAVLVLLACSSLSAMFANIFFHQAERVERQWQRGTPVTQLQLESAQAWVAKSLYYSPGQPDYSQLQGRLFAWAYIGQLSVDKAGQQLALQGYRNSLAARPYWPYAWAQFSLLKAQMHEFDEEFGQAFNNAQSYGYWEPQVMESLLNASLMYWSELSWPQRKQAKDLFERSLSFRPVMFQAMNIAEASGMSRALCFTLDKSKLHKRIVKRCR